MITVSSILFACVGASLS